MYLISPTSAYMRAPVFAVWLQARDEVTCPRFHSDGLAIQGDNVGSDLCPIAVWLVPFQKQAGRRRETRLCWSREVQESEGWDLVGICRRGPETHLLAVGTSSCLIHRLSGKTKKRQTGWDIWSDETRDVIESGGWETYWGQEGGLRKMRMKTEKDYDR